MYIQVILSTLLALSAGDPFLANYGAHPYAYTAGLTSGYISPVVRTVHTAPIAAVAPVARVAPVAAVAPVAPVAGAAPVAPVAVKSLPVSAVAPEAVVPSVSSSQFHSQDEAGNFAFGYNNVNGAREESGNVDTGVTTGSYTNAYGRQVNYVADNYGFRLV